MEYDELVQGNGSKDGKMYEGRREGDKKGMKMHNVNVPVPTRSVNIMHCTHVLICQCLLELYTNTRQAAVSLPLSQMWKNAKALCVLEK